MSWEYHQLWYWRMLEPPPTPAPAGEEDAEVQRQAGQLYRRFSLLNTKINQRRYSRRWR